ncbi:MAG: hypothetical protein RLZZ385_1137 [Pseudomonadota bacterium]
MKVWAGGVFAVVLLLGIGFFVYSSVCPCATVPGALLLGERVDTPVTDWNTTSANQEDLCQLQVWAGIRPHSINLNCMATPQGELFLSCSVCATKYWAAQVEANEPAVLRLGERIYPVYLNRETDPVAMERSFRARVLKLQTTDLATMVGPRPDPDEQRPDHWWTFRVTSRI